MKIKSNPIDFQVTEITSEALVDQGRYSLYKLAKSGWTTPDAIAIIQKAWKLPYERISFGGLKDRHARTSQFLTIWDGPEQAFHRNGIDLEYLGRSLTAFDSSKIAANRFQLTVRDLSEAMAQRLPAILPEIGRVGLPNYFDDQRFGSVGRDRRFIAREMIAGNFEEALKLALVGDYEHDRSESKREKDLLRKRWGDWGTLKETLPRGPARKLASYLAYSSNDYRGAVTRLQPELQGMYLAAYQSDIWNRTLARWLEESQDKANLSYLATKLGSLPSPIAMADDRLDVWKNLVIPLPSARLKPAGNEPWLAALTSVLAEEKCPLESMKIDVRKPFFSKGLRQACVFPADLNHRFLDDEAHPGRLKLEISFDLPPGSYATIVLKRLFGEQAQTGHFSDANPE